MSRTVSPAAQASTLLSQEQTDRSLTSPCFPEPRDAILLHSKPRILVVTALLRGAAALHPNSREVLYVLPAHHHQQVPTGSPSPFFILPRPLAASVLRKILPLSQAPLHRAPNLPQMPSG